MKIMISFYADYASTQKSFKSAGFGVEGSRPEIGSSAISRHRHESECQMHKQGECMRGGTGGLLRKNLDF